MNREQIEGQLVSQFKWAKEQIDFGLRDNFRCRYCGQDMLDSVNSFRGWTLDHIVPKSKLDENVREDPENIALACWTCNIIKRQWDPRTKTPSRIREDLIRAVQDFVTERRAHLEEDLRKQRELVVQLRAIAPHYK
jgi:5-methylcytosine-specific restriction endonuclease McrA